MSPNQKGISHILLPLLIVIVAAIGGTYYLVSSKADQVTSTGSVKGNTNPVDIAPDPGVPAPGTKTATAATNKPPLKPAFSYNWSGYVMNAGKAERFNFVSGYVKVPKVKCTGEETNLSIWVGLDGWGSNSVEQDGIAAWCPPGYYTPVYNAWWEMWPHNAMQVMNLTIRPGDKIYMETKYANGQYEFRVKNITTHKLAKKISPCTNASCERTSAEWVIERPGYGAPTKNHRYYKLANYGSSKIYGAKVGSGTDKPHTIQGYYQINGGTGAFPVYMTDGNKNFLATVQNPLQADDRFTGKYVRH